MEKYKFKYFWYWGGSIDKYIPMFTATDPSHEKYNSDLVLSKNKITPQNIENYEDYKKELSQISSDAQIQYQEKVSSFKQFFINETIKSKINNN